MRRGLVFSAVTTLLAFSLGSPALAQEAQQYKEHCADPAPTAYQYGCHEPRLYECEPSQQYADDATASPAAEPHEYGECLVDIEDSDVAQQAQEDQAAGGTGALPPASVQNVVVDVANSVSEDAPEASRALDAARPAQTGDNVALADEDEPSETVAEAPAQPSEALETGLAPTGEVAPSEVPAQPYEAPQEVATGETAPPTATAPDAVAAPAEPPTATAPDAAAAPAEPSAEVTQRAEATEPAETTEVVAEQGRRLEEANGELAASDQNVPVDQFVVPLFALGGSVLLVGGGFLVRRMVG